MRRAFKIGYLAEGFFGYAPQPHKTTVGGLLEQELRKRKAIDPEARFLTASRTDRGVHALGNVVAFDTPLRGDQVSRILNVVDPRIFCFGYATVPPTFTPRHAVSRWYRYFLNGESHDATLLASLAQEFVGEHDFESFSRKDDPPRNTRRSITKMEVTSRGRYLTVDVVAHSFLWGQVRKMISALVRVESGRLGLRDLRDALEGRRRLTLPMATPARLVLVDVSYAFPFEPVTDGVSRRTEEVDRSLAELGLKASLLGLFREAMIGGSPMPSAVSG